VTENHLTWLQVTGIDPEMTWFQRKSPVSGCRRPKAKFWVRLSSYRAVTRRRWQSRGRKWSHVTPRDRSDPEVTSYHRKSPGSGCRRPISQVLGAFELLQGCNSEVAVTWQEMTHVTPRYRKWRYLTGSHLEVAVEGL